MRHLDSKNRKRNFPKFYGVDFVFSTSSTQWHGPVTGVTRLVARCNCSTRVEYIDKRKSAHASSKAFRNKKSVIMLRCFNLQDSIDKRQSTSPTQPEQKNNTSEAM